jgi:preprotein translocase subunit SecA
MFKWLGNPIDSNEKVLNKIRPIVAKINSLEPEFEKLSDERLKAKTWEFKRSLGEATVDIQQRVATTRLELLEAKKRLAEAQDKVTRESGELAYKQLQEKFEQLEKQLLKAHNDALDGLIPEAFAAVREAGKRTISQRHSDVQLISGIVLHQGKIAEIKNGESTALVATLPLYLNALLGKGVHMVTVDDYVAQRDYRWMGPVYSALGISVSGIQHTTSSIYDQTYKSTEEGWSFIRPITRKDAYQADITYGTIDEFGLDYLRDNMVIDLNQSFQRDLNYAILDEVDSMLIDKAHTPLVISGPAAQGNLKNYSLG